MSKTAEAWTNSSVRQLSGDNDPIEVITDRARAMVQRALDRGWEGPPYDPMALADLIDVRLRATEDVRDARTVADSAGILRIDYNPGRPRARVRFSIAHEIGHSLFPDCADRVRHRAAYHELIDDDWQLEVLCNIAASELLMPAGSISEEELGSLSIEHLLHLRRQYEVSMEALLHRMVRVSKQSIAVFAAAPIDRNGTVTGYRIEYVVGSSGWPTSPSERHVLKPGSVVASCTAIGLTATADENWPGSDDLFHIECVAVQPHPGGTFPRVVGFLRPHSPTSQPPAEVQEVPGDALEPHRAGPAIIAHVVNDRTPRWGGRGFASALAGRYPRAQSDFVDWVSGHPGSFRLGSTHRSQLDSRLSIVHMVAQAGYGPSRQPRIRYEALQDCLEQLAAIAVNAGATVHMPRIGTGAGGGRWEVIRDMIETNLSRRGVTVLVYSTDTRGHGELTRTAQEEFALGADRAQ